VIDKDLLYDEAIWACRLFDTLTRQTLRSHVRKEPERRMMQAQEENGKVEMYVVICKRGQEEVCACNKRTLATGEPVLPLTTPTTNSTSSAEGSNNVTSASRRSKIRKTPRQATQDRINAKAESSEFYKRYSGAAFKEATRIIYSGCHDGTVKELINNLNLKYDLIANGKRKHAKSTIYRAIAKGNAGKSPLKNVHIQ
jgi:hypothetical protein